MGNLALGIDTGGTFTDGVVFNLDSKEILEKTKVITTRHDLTGAIENCLLNLLDNGRTSISLDQLKMVSLSTTLATNATVEGQGAEVGLIIIGSSPGKKLPTPHFFSVAGGCDIRGEIKKELDLKEVERGVKELKDKVEAFAVSGYLSVRNPQQEKQVEQVVRELTGLPVVLAHQLSSDLGFYERTITAIFNARLIPLITGLIDAVKEIMEKKGIDAPLMVVKGDGGLINEKTARERPVETLLSGPAASIVGAMTLTGLQEGVVVDMGGTTTDVAVLKEGRPRLHKEGAMVGGWRTRVKAADITTIGLGGDSLISIAKNGELSIGPQRVFPLAWMVHRHPELLEDLKEIRESGFFPLDTQPTTMFSHIRDPRITSLSSTEEEILQLVKERPRSLFYLSRKLGKDPEIVPWQRLVNVGSLHRASLTPTDIMHYENSFTPWNLCAARLGLEIMARRKGVTEEELIEHVLEEIYYCIGSVIVLTLLEKEGQNLLKGEGPRFFMEKILSPVKNNEQISLEAKVNVPLMAVGAPVMAYFPTIAKRINASLYLPPAAEVANAVGTVSGSVVERLRVLIKPGPRGGFLVYTPRGREGFLELSDALEYGHREGQDYVFERALLAGATDVEIIMEQHDSYGRLGREEDRIFIETILEVTAVGKPWGDW